MSTMLCEGCGNNWPVDKFPNIGLEAVCEYCLLNEDIEKAKKLSDAKALAVLDKLSDQDTSLSSVKDVVTRIYSEFGGPVGFAKKFAMIIDNLTSRDRIPPAAAQLLLSVVKLHYDVESKEEGNDLRKMTDDQIRRAQDLELARLVMDASNDPGRRAVLGSMLKRSGFRLEAASPAERIREAIESEVTDAASESA